jgi:hypothetical protein
MAKAIPTGEIPLFKMKTGKISIFPKSISFEVVAIVEEISDRLVSAREYST